MIGKKPLYTRSVHHTQKTPMRGVFSYHQEHDVLSNKPENALRHIVQHFIRHSRIEPDPEAVIHDAVGVHELAGDAVVLAVFEIIEAGVAREVPREEVSRLDIVLFEMLDEIVARKRDTFAQGHQVTEPARVAFIGGLRKRKEIFKRF